MPKLDSGMENLGGQIWEGWRAAMVLVRALELNGVVGPPHSHTDRLQPTTATPRPEKHPNLTILSCGLAGFCLTRYPIPLRWPWQGSGAPPGLP